MSEEYVAYLPHITPLEHYADLQWHHFQILAGLGNYSLERRQLLEESYQRWRQHLPHFQNRPFEYPFEQRCSLTIAGTLHQLGTGDILLEGWDNSDPRQEILPDWEAIDPTTYDVQVVFAIPYTGVLLLYPNYLELSQWTHRYEEPRYRRTIEDAFRQHQWAKDVGLST